jgi:demethylmenaquinone methyltransferase/2-methoxy-6-polyprenyl-1,4-benzoquinol methylase
MKESVAGPPAEYIQNLFGSISTRYDQANDVITMGLAHRWRKKLVKWSGVQAGQRVLDCATGTGDLALEFKRVVGESGEVVGSDFCQPMLDMAPQKALAQALKVEFLWGDVTQLQFPDHQFDVTSIAYGIRNVRDPILAITEMARVTRSKGLVMILETGEPRLPILGWAMRIYFRYIVPKLGGWVTGKKSAYEYLNQSSNKFPCRQDFVDILLATGVFSNVEFKTLMLGASYIYKATVK